MQKNCYALKVGKSAEPRLKVLNKIYNPLSHKFFKARCFGDNLNILDMGCGTGEMTLWIANNISPQGLVVGLDNSEAQIAVANEQYLHHKLDNARFIVGSVHDELLEQQITTNIKFDLVYCRFFLMHMNDIALVLNKIKNLLKDDGQIIFEEPIMSEVSCHPMSKSFYKYRHLLNQLAIINSTNFDIGAVLQDAVLEANFKIHCMQNVQPKVDTKQKKKIMPLSLLECSSQYLNNKLATEQEINELLLDLTNLANDNDFSMMFPKMVQIHASKA